MNFGQDIIRCVNLFYTYITSVIINNGRLSEAFNIEKGVRQGCLLSTSLFCMYWIPLCLYK